MTTIESSSHVILRRDAPFTLGEDQLAAVAFLARSSGRTLEAYRPDLRALFQWADDHDLPVLEASRTHLELYRTSMEERGRAASTIDRRLSTACGFCAAPGCDGRRGGAWIGAGWPGCCSPPSASITPTPPWPCCWA